MEQQVLATGPNPTVIVEAAQGDLHIMGWEQPEVLARTRSDRTLTLDQQDESIVVRCDDDCVMRVPAGASLQILRVSGDARIKLARGALTVGKVSGDLGLQGVGADDDRFGLRRSDRSIRPRRSGGRPGERRLLGPRYRRGLLGRSRERRPQAQRRERERIGDVPRRYQRRPFAGGRPANTAVGLRRPQRAGSNRRQRPNQHGQRRAGDPRQGAGRVQCDRQGRATSNPGRRRSRGESVRQRQHRAGE